MNMFPYIILAAVVLVIVLVNVYIRRHPLTPEEEKEVDVLMQKFQP